MKSHPFAAVFPLLDQPELAALVSDITGAWAARADLDVRGGHP